jgi:uncharacterized membrane protein YphA (DoxX/SURF4 family)
MLVPGLIQLFVSGSASVSVLFLEFGFPFPLSWAWLLIAAQLIAGLALLTHYNVVRFAWIAIGVIIFTLLFVVIRWEDIVHTNLSSLLLHLIALVSYVALLSEE